MEICLIMPDVFPVPATKGGATETLMANVLKENEKEGKIHFTCVSVYEEEAERLSRNYKHTKFLYMKQRRDNLDLTFESNDTAFESYMDDIYDKIKNENFDFIIIEGGDISGYQYLLKRFPKEKCLVHIHGNALGDSTINNQIYSKYIAISEYTRKLIIENGNVKKTDVELLYNAIELKDFDKKISEEERLKLREKYDIKPDDIVIFFAGRTIPEKGIKQLINSFEKMKNINRAKLLIVGSANYGERVKTDYDYEIEEAAKPVQNRIRFTGYIDNKELYKIHNISDIAVVPSMWEELFGLVVVEAMSSGLPLIVTKSGGIPEIVDDSCAYVIKKDENLIKNMTEKLDFLVENPETRIKMGNNGKIRSKKYGMEQYLNNFYNLVNKLKK